MRKEGKIVGFFSGDTIVVQLDEKAEYIAIGLKFVQAPKLGMFDGTKPDEPGAWNSFEFLRDNAMAKRVSINIDRAPSDQQRMHSQFGQMPFTYGIVTLIDKRCDLGEIVLKSGWARVNSGRSPPKGSEDYVDTLKDAENAAKDSSLGIWGKDLMVRHLPVEIDSQALLKQREFDGLVEGVLNGSLFTVWLYPRMELVTIQLAGIRCPSAKRSGPEPYGIEAKKFSEGKLFQRRVKVRLFSQTETSNFIGQILHPVGGDISVFLLDNGLAEVNNNTMMYLTNCEDLRAAEKRAKQAKKNKWKNFDPRVLDTSSIDGIVVCIKGSNSVEIESSSGVKRVWLSCCKVPMFNPSQSSEAFGVEAREKMRQMLIGRNVQCTVDYTIEDRSYATIYVGNICVNEVMVESGLGTVITSKSHPSSERIDAMLRAEESAKQKRLGIHKGSGGNTMFNDLSSKHSREKSVPFLHYFERKPQKGIVEYCVSATRHVVLIPDHHCIIRMNLKGICACDPKERIGSEGLYYCQQNLLQRDVEVEISEVDKVGMFIGSMSLVDARGKHSVEADLLSKGFTEIHEGSIGRCRSKKEMEAAQKKAQDSGLGIWSGRKQTNVIALEHGKVYEVNVADVLGPTTLALQMQSDALQRINEGLSQARNMAKGVMKGDLVAVVYEEKLYRGRVLRIEEDQAEIDFLELFIHDWIPLKDLRMLPKPIVSIPAQGFKVELGLCKPFHLGDEFDDEAMSHLWSLCEDKKLYVHLIASSSQSPRVLLTDSPSKTGGSLNAVVLAHGMAQINNYEVYPEFESLVSDFEAIQEQAKSRREGAWKRGDVGGDDEGDY